jgi:monofunctional biosynthetic peptidoglycan transglycosylase
MKVLKIIKIILIVFTSILLTYSVVFSIATTTALVWVALQIKRPIDAIIKLKTENPQRSLFMEAYQKTLNKNDPADTLLHLFVPLDSISPALVKAVIASEDDGFYIHPGFDIEAILQAYTYNKERNKFSHGASTLTQQVAKNIFAGSEKSFSRKFNELFYTILMEQMLGKERILELYLNYAQWGEKIFGCEAASRYYFKKPAKKLSYPEASKLAAVLAKPCKLSPVYTKSGFMDKRLEVIATNLYRKHLIGDSMFLLLGGPDSLLARPDTLEEYSGLSSGMGGSFRYTVYEKDKKGKLIKKTVVKRNKF